MPKNISSNSNNLKALFMLFLSVMSLIVYSQDENIKVDDEILNFQNLFDAKIDEGVACHRIPAIVTAPNGDLIAAIDQRVPSCGDVKWNKDINIVIRRSADNGDSWSKIETIVDYPFGESASDPSMIVDKITGDIFLFFNYMDLDNQKDVYYLKVIKSVDNGKTWSSPVDITSQIAKPEWYNNFKFITSGRGIQTDSGKLIHTLVNLEKGLYLFGSDDHGETWYFIDSPIVPANESKIVELVDGTWMINSRVGDLGFRYVHTSTDEGATWVSKPDSSLVDPGCNASIIRYTSVNNGADKNRLLFANANSKDERKNMTIRISYDEGETWTEGKTIYAGSSAYSSLTVLSNGDIGLFFEKDNYQENVFVRLSLEWLTDGKDTYSKPPIMGWASWNNYRININEDIIKAQADAMISSGLINAGYSFINIDDGYFGGRDENGKLISHKQRFPSGMKSLADYIHSKGLKAGIYSDAGLNTCASYWYNDTIGVGVGLYGNEEQDLKLFLTEWDYDFIKIDWCGGEWLGLDEQTSYTNISKLIRSIKPDAIFNVCRWKFPGDWVTQIADSWRISGDINNDFESILRIIDLNADLSMYASAGHYNDMDMLQVGRGMSYEEDKSHFSMWCMMQSPLLLGNDLTNMSKETIEIITNEDIIALNQSPFVYQARRLVDYGEQEVWAKPLLSINSGEIAIALLNRSDKTETITFSLKSIGLDASKKYTIKDLWTKETFPSSTQTEITRQVVAHGVVVLKISGQSLPNNVF